MNHNSKSGDGFVDDGYDHLSLAPLAFRLCQVTLIVLGGRIRQVEIGEFFEHVVWGFSDTADGMSGLSKGVPAACENGSPHDHARLVDIDIPVINVRVCQLQ